MLRRVSFISLKLQANFGVRCLKRSNLLVPDIEVPNTNENTMMLAMKSKKIPFKNTVIAAKNLRSNLATGSASMLIVNGTTAPGRPSGKQYNIYL